MSATLPCSQFVPDEWRKFRCRECFCKKEDHGKEPVTDSDNVKRQSTATTQSPPQVAPKPDLHNKIKPIDGPPLSDMTEGMFQKFLQEFEIVLTVHLLNLLILFIGFSRKGNIR